LQFPELEHIGEQPQCHQWIRAGLVFEQQIHPDGQNRLALVTLMHEWNPEKQVALLFLQVGGNERAVDAFRLCEVQMLHKLRAVDAEQIAKIARIF
jgi:hypothetical protein